MDCMQRSRTLICVFALTLTGGCARPFLARPPVVVQREAWTFRGVPGSVLTTSHYKLHTTCRDPMLLDALPRILEGAYVEYAKLVPPPAAASAPSRPMVSYVFATRDQWEAFTRRFAGDRSGTYLKIRSGGYEENGVTAAHYSRRNVTLSTLTHEGLHQYLSVTGRRDVPPWVNEGLACYFEAFELDDEGWPVFRPRENLLRRPNLREALRRNRLFRVEELVSMDAGRAVRAGEEHARVYYAQIWALTLYLSEPSLTNEDAHGFRKLLAELGTERMRLAAGGVRGAASPESRGSMSQGEAIFRYYITNDMAGFTQRYHAFMKKLAGTES